MLDETLMGYLNLVKEFPEYEYELKFDVLPHKRVHDFLKSPRYCRSDMPGQKETLVSHYCGGVVVVQRISKNGQYVVSNQKSLFELKTKGRPESLNCKINGAEWIMKRKEDVKGAELSDVIKAVQSEKFEGSVLKRVEYDYVMDRESGRVFELAYAHMDNLRPVVAQLEVEYVGISKNKNVGDERQLISNLVDLGKCLVDATPTKKNKRDFILR